MITAKTLPMGRCNVLFMLSQFREKWVLPIEKVQVFVQAKNTIMLQQHLIIHFFALLSVKWLLTEG